MILAELIYKFISDMGVFQTKTWLDKTTIHCLESFKALWTV